MSEIEGIRPLGVSGGFGIVEPAGQPCDDCGEQPGEPHGCIMDGAYHRHGMTHVYTDGLTWLCHGCYRHACDEELRRLHDMRRGVPGEPPEWWLQHVERVQRLRPL